MKHLFCVSLFLFFGNSFSNAQCFNPTNFNGSLDFSNSTTSVPNDMAPSGWSKQNTPDQAKTGIQIDCTTLPLVASANGGSWTRMADKVTAQEAIYRNISGFTVGTYYQVSFEQSLVKNWARSSGNVRVVVGATSRNSPTIALPAAGTAQTTWQSVTVGPFLATSATMTVMLEAHSNQDGTGSSAMPGSCSGYTQNALAADLMIDGVSICPITSLPLSFLSYEITSEHNLPALAWTIVDSDQELEKFVILKSTDLITWNTVATLLKENNNGNYSFRIGWNNSSSDQYYKIIAYDKTNAAIATSSILSDALQRKEKPCGWVYHKGSLELTTVELDNDLSVMLFDLQGNALQEYSFSKKTIPSISVTKLPEAPYIIYSSNVSEHCAFRFVK